MLIAFYKSPLPQAPPPALCLPPASRPRRLTALCPVPVPQHPQLSPRAAPPGLLGHRLPLPISPGCHTQTHRSLLCTLCSRGTKGSQTQSKGNRTRRRILVEGSRRGLSPCPPRRSRPRIPACDTLLPASRSSLAPIALGGISPRPAG